MRRFIVGVAIVVLLVASLLVGYYFYAQPRTTKIELAGVTLTVELATTPAAQQQGLSDRGFVVNELLKMNFFRRYGV